MLPKQAKSRQPRSSAMMKTMFGFEESAANEEARMTSDEMKRRLRMRFIGCVANLVQSFRARRRRRMDMQFATDAEKMAFVNAGQ